MIRRFTILSSGNGITGNVMAHDIAEARQLAMQEARKLGAEMHPFEVFAYGSVPEGFDLDAYEVLAHCFTEKQAQATAWAIDMMLHRGEDE